MKKAINSVTFLLLVFIFFLSLSSAFSAAISGLFYYSAYVVPVILAMLYFKASEKDEIRPTALRIMPDKKSALFSIPFVFPFVAIVLLISFLTSLVLNTLGFSYATDVSGNIFAVITKHVLLPAFLEEAVFRFIPIALIAPYSKKNAVVISSVFFAVVHCNLFQIPYALFAGLVLSYVALATGSIFPAVALHFLNNLSSVILMRNDSLAFSIAFIAVLSSLAVVSVVFIIIKREKYGELLREIRREGATPEFTLAGLLFVFAMLFIGVFNLWTNF